MVREEREVNRGPQAVAGLVFVDADTVLVQVENIRCPRTVDIGEPDPARVEG